MPPASSMVHREDRILATDSHAAKYMWQLREIHFHVQRMDFTSMFIPYTERHCEAILSHILSYL